MIRSLGWKGAPQSAFLLERLITQSQGRLIILHGEKGIGKTTLALLTLSHLYGESFIFSQNFQFFRPDQYDMKLSYYLKTISPTNQKHLLLWGVQFLHQLSHLLYLKEIKAAPIKYRQKNLTIDEFCTFLQDLLQRENCASVLSEDQQLQKILLLLAEKISERTHIPISFIHEVIRFHQYKSDTARVTFIGNWEQATLEAQNASLKLFEEMPSSSHIILHTNNIERILPTIISRSVIITFPPLSPTQVSEILHIEKSDFQSCFHQMRESLFQERQNALRMAEEFFLDIAFHLQNNTTLFSFIEKISADNTFTIIFLESLEDVLRKLWLSHQEEIRHTVFTHTQTMSAKHTVFLSETKHWMKEIQTTKNLLKKAPLQANYLLTDLLINLARWIQKRKKK